MTKDNNSVFPGKYEIAPSNSPVVNEIFRNDFDFTWHYPYFIAKSDLREWPLIPGENTGDSDTHDGTVTYKYNNSFFRCDEFTTTHSGMHVLFAGCSETEGQGGNIEDVWAKMMFDKIKNNNLDGFYSVGKSGFGWQKIITQIRVYIEKYGKPDSLFILLPNIGRLMDWSDQLNDWYYRQQYPRFGENALLDKHKDNESDPYRPTEQTPQEYKKGIIDFTISWRLFEDFCSASDIKLLWGTWEPIDNHNFERLNLFNNFVPLHRKGILTNIEKYRKDAVLLPNDLDKRDGHHGRLFHEYWADSFIKEAKKRGYLK